MTASDITSQIEGPYTAATFSTPKRDASTRWTIAERITPKMKTADQPNATPTCISMPIAIARLPPVSAPGPMSVDATP
jgi:hypothetical protein